MVKTSSHRDDEDEESSKETPTGQDKKTGFSRQVAQWKNRAKSPTKRGMK
jgi:hypothetical protein